MKPKYATLTLVILVSITTAIFFGDITNTTIHQHAPPLPPPTIEVPYTNPVKILPLPTLPFPRDPAPVHVPGMPKPDPFVGEHWTLA